MTQILISNANLTEQVLENKCAERLPLCTETLLQSSMCTQKINLRKSFMPYTTSFFITLIKSWKNKCFLKIKKTEERVIWRLEENRNMCQISAVNTLHGNRINANRLNYGLSVVMKIWGNPIINKTQSYSKRSIQLKETVLSHFWNYQTLTQSKWMVTI